MTEATAHEIATFNLHLLRKDALVAIAKQLGIRKDFCPIRLAPLRAMLKPFGPAKLHAAASALPEFFDAEDLANLANPELAEDEAADANEQAQDEADTGKAAPASATPQRAAPPASAPHAPNVNQVAALLAQLLATGKAGLDADEVRGIVEPMVSEYATSTLHTVRDWISDAIKDIPPREIIVKSERAEVKLEGRQHKGFDSLLQLCAARQPDGHRLNVWLYGPPGTGKTTAARNVAKALELDFQCNGAMGTKYELTGFIDAGGTYRGTPFRRAWEHGGVYLFDEIDGSVPAAVVAFNAALANGVMAFPDGMVERHPDCVIVAAANTTGNGATAEFTGRMKLDAATMDRFILLEWAIDEALERAMCPFPDWADAVQSFRAKVASKGVKVQITPRATIYGASLLAQGLPEKTVRELVLRKGMTADQWAMLA